MYHIFYKCFESNFIWCTQVYHYLYGTHNMRTIAWNWGFNNGNNNCSSHGPLWRCLDCTDLCAIKMLLYRLEENDQGKYYINIIHFCVGWFKIIVSRIRLTMAIACMYNTIPLWVQLIWILFLLKPSSIKPICIFDTSVLRFVPNMEDFWKCTNPLDFGRYIFAFW